MRGLSADLSAWAEERSAPVVATIAAFVLVMAFTLLAHPLLHVGHADLISPSDLWSLANSSSALLHGHFSRIYVPNGALTSPPALEVALLPFIAFGDLVGLSPHLHATGQPLSMWFVLGPAAIALACTALFALDAVARRWNFSPGPVWRWRSSVGWGWPTWSGDGAIPRTASPSRSWSGRRSPWSAMALRPRPGPPSCWAWPSRSNRWRSLAWHPSWPGSGWRAAGRLWWRLVVPSAAVLVPPLVAETHRTLFVLTRQPFQPRLNSFTPLTHLAPVLGPDLDGGGPTRLVATLLAVALAIVVCRRRHDLVTVLTVTAGAFFIRVALETELNWYYLWPVPALCLLLALRKTWPRFWVCATALVVSMMLGDRRVHHIALWWPGMMATAVVMLLSIGPTPRRWIELAGGQRAVPVAARGTS